MAPNQVFSLHTCSEEVPQQEGYLLLMHPDFSGIHLWRKR